MRLVSIISMGCSALRLPNQVWTRLMIDVNVVAPNGAFGMHTLVAERVPSDPAWFYLEPPHCAFFSNAAMARLSDDLRSGGAES